jgi:hypothetical protein
MTIDDLLLRAEITDVLTRYCRGIDRGDVELIRSAYHPDSTEDHGNFHGLSHDYAAHIVAKLEASGALGQHDFLNMTIERDGDDAALVETHFWCVNPYTDPDGERDTALLAGRYLDRFEKRDGLWAIAARRVILDWSRAHVGADDWFGAVDYPRGGRREADPSIPFFAKRPI